MKYCLSSEAMGLGRRDVRAGGPSGKGGRRAYSVRLGCHAQPEGVPRAVPQLVGRPTAQGHQRTQVRRCSGGVGRHLISPTALATLPDARTPQSHCPPLPHGNACAGPQRESLRVVKVAVESGYTQQKIQPWRRRDVRRSRVKGRGQGTPRCAHLTDSGLRAIRQAQPPRHAPTVAPARAGLRPWIDVHRPHGSGSPCAQPLALKGGLKVRPYPSERRPSVSRADGGNEGHRDQLCWRGSYYRLHLSC